MGFMSSPVGMLPDLVGMHDQEYIGSYGHATTPDFVEDNGSIRACQATNVMMGTRGQTLGG